MSLVLASALVTGGCSSSHLLPDSDPRGPDARGDSEGSAEADGAREGSSASTDGTDDPGRAGSGGSGPSTILGDDDRDSTDAQSDPADGDAPGMEAGCNLPVVDTAAILDGAGAQRFALAQDYCATIVRDDCLEGMGGSSFIAAGAAGCSDDASIVACAQDQLYTYELFMTSPCDTSWTEAMRCLTAAAPDVDCSARGLHSWLVGNSFCKNEKDALSACLDEHHVEQRVTGTRTTCDYGTGVTNQCNVWCAVDGRNFLLECGGPEGLPMRCTCDVNGSSLGDWDLGSAEIIYAADCADAAARAADGACTSRLDCCFQYEDGGATQCACGSDPTSLGFDTCEELAAFADGEVVAGCPNNGVILPCWPPPCAG